MPTPAVDLHPNLMHQRREFQRSACQAPQNPLVHHALVHHASAVQVVSRGPQSCSKGPAAFDIHLVFYSLIGKADSHFSLHETRAKGRWGHACLCSPGGQQESPALFRESRDLRCLPFFLQIGELGQFSFR